MKIHLLSVGKPRESEAVALHDRYRERIERFGVRYEASWVPDVRPGGRFSVEHSLKREAERLLERVEPRGTLVAVDPGGRMFGSDELASRLERWATPTAWLVVGGPSGLHANVLERADQRWSLSRLTFPHELARVIVAEQIYRALTILRRVPYHR